MSLTGEFPTRKDKTRFYSGFAGVDFSSEPSRVDKYRFPYLVNMYRDYDSEQGAATETVPGFRRIASFSGKCHGIFSYSVGGVAYTAAHFGTHLYTFKTAERDLLSSSSYYSVFDGLADADSSAFCVRDRLYILDGQRLLVLSDGVLADVFNSAYVPVTFSDGEPYEQRNMLTPSFIERYNVASASAFLGTRNICTYDVTDDVNHYVKVTGAAACRYLFIPSSVVIEGISYTVTSVGASAFRDSLLLREVYIPSSVTLISEYAFCGCTALSGVYFSEGLTEIKHDAFQGCTALSRLFLPDSLTTVGADAFETCIYLSHVVFGNGLRLSGIGSLAFDNIYHDALIFIPVNLATFAGAGGTESDVLSGVGSYTYTYGAAVVELALDEVYNSSVTPEEYYGFDYYDEHDVFTVYSFGADVVVGTAASGASTVYTFRSAKQGYAVIEFGAVSDYERRYVLLRVSSDGLGTVSPELIGTARDYRFTIHEPCVNVSRVTVENTDVAELDGFSVFYSRVGEYIEAVVLYSDDGVLADNIEVNIYGSAEPSKFTSVAGATLFSDGNIGYAGTARQAVCGCTIACAYDGRIFLTGNPDLPNTVFYSGRDGTGYNNPSYFGVLNYFNDGTGAARNVAMITSGGYLLVFKDGTDGESGIYFHSGEDSSLDILPRIYPSVSGMSGIYAVGAACNFADDPVFLSVGGLEAVGRQAVNSERAIVHRSSRVDVRLRAEEPATARLTEWGGYLVLMTRSGGVARIYLADSRQMSGGEYEWYYLDDIGVYVGQVDLYRRRTDYVPLIHGGVTYDAADCYIYSAGTYKRLSYAPSVVDVSVGGQSSGTPYVKGAGGVYTPLDGLTVYYVIDGDNCYICDSDGEKVGGVYSPACVIHGYAGLLFFGTEGGALCVFNTDKRGVAYNTGIVDGEGGAVFEAVASDSIHRSWYTRDGRRYVSGCSTVFDSCGYPNAVKDTVKGSSVVRIKQFYGGAVVIRGRTDIDGWCELGRESGNVFSFDALDFGNFNFSAEGERTIVFRDRFKRWIYKQYYFLCDAYMGAFGVYDAAFGYFIRGRIKR